MRHAAAERQALLSYLKMLAGSQPGPRLIDIRWPDPDAPLGMAQKFLRARKVDELARTIAQLSNHADVYTGVLLRSRRAGGRDSLTDSHLLWAEVDHPDAITRLHTLALPPTMLIASGSPGHAHAYWLLRHPVDAQLVPDYNRHLAHTAGGDLNAIDAARILRPPSTLNHKHTPPTRVELLHADLTRRYHLGELLDAFPRPPATPPAPSAAPAERVGIDRQLLAIPAADYARRLAGREPDRAGKISCPFHTDRTPSLQLYPDGTFYCYGCGAGGSLYDFAARLWGLDTKGRDFIRLRRRLTEELRP